jgi:hypothetical protein
MSPHARPLHGRSRGSQAQTNGSGRLAARLHAPGTGAGRRSGQGPPMWAGPPRAARGAAGRPSEKLPRSFLGQQPDQDLFGLQNQIA